MFAILFIYTIMIWCCEFLQIPRKGAGAIAIDADLFTADESVTGLLTALPDNMAKAILLAENSDFVKSVIGEELLLRYVSVKKIEAADFAAAADKKAFYAERHFGAV